MKSEQFTPQQIATLIVRAIRLDAYFDTLAGRSHQQRFPKDDPFTLAVAEMRAAAALYRKRLEAIGQSVGVADPWPAYNRMMQVLAERERRMIERKAALLREREARFHPPSPGEDGA